MRVVADTGPLHYLVLIKRIDLLPRLFGAVSIPAAVRAELDRPMTPPLVREWATTPPPWLTVEPTPESSDAALAALDDGERATVALADLLHADLVLMDDRAGVAVARVKGFAVTGTLGVLDRAARRGLIDLAAAVTALKATNFHITQKLLDAILPQSRQGK